MLPIEITKNVIDSSTLKSETTPTPSVVNAPSMSGLSLTADIWKIAINRIAELYLRTNLKFIQSFPGINELNSPRRFRSEERRVGKEGRSSGRRYGQDKR